VSPLLPEAAYVYAGNGLGIPGLPHRVTPALCRAHPELEPLFRGGFAAGLYVREAQPEPVKGDVVAEGA